MHNLEITNVFVDKIEKSKKIVGFAKIVFNGVLMISDICIIKNGKELSVYMPNKKDKDGTFKRIVTSYTTDLSDYIAKAVIEEYKGCEE